MKKSINLVVALTCVMALVGCGSSDINSGVENVVEESEIVVADQEENLQNDLKDEGEKYEATGEETARADSITICIQEFSPNGATFIIENETDKEIEYGDYFTLQVLNSKNWEDVEYINDIAFKDIGYNLPAKSRTKSIEIDWENMYGVLPEGKYKLVKFVSSEQEVHEVFDDFELKDNK